ncbi:Ctf8-domain-containing protein [Dichomitus squalens]|uniref:Ctf8-domain-containing protein n=1 Tax=Dichomitus squalens TaxID=114155 RepID=A0A4Q9PG44_9APHY|nr:Ctf8-domain-containing protein [Dichomitus squalens]
MLIPINIDLPGPSTPRRPNLPPQLIQFGTDELILIELQGSLEVEGNRDGQLVGKLRVDAVTKPTLVIGHHLLEGKMVSLNKPLAVLHRHDARASHDGADEDASMDVDGPLKGGEAKSWDMIAIVKRKMVFSKRPMPIASSTKGITTPLSRIGSKT